MTRVRRLEIRTFRSIQVLDWAPSNGVNCLIGPGDSGKSSILDAIYLCLGEGKSAPFGDTDFFRVKVSRTIETAVTLGALIKAPFKKRAACSRGGHWAKTVPAELDPSKREQQSSQILIGDTCIPSARRLSTHRVAVSFGCQGRVATCLKNDMEGLRAPQ